MDGLVFFMNNLIHISYHIYHTIFLSHGDVHSFDILGCNFWEQAFSKHIQGNQIFFSISFQWFYGILVQLIRNHLQQCLLLKTFWGLWQVSCHGHKSMQALKQKVILFKIYIIVGYFSRIIFTTRASYTMLNKLDLMYCSFIVCINSWSVGRLT